MAVFGTAVFGTSTFGGTLVDSVTLASILPVALPRGRASYTLRSRCYLSDKNGVIGDDVSQYILDGSVKVDANAETPMTFSGQTTDPAAIPAFGWIAPFLTVEFWDAEEGTQQITEQVGLYVVLPPGETHTAAQGIGRIDGRDPTWVLKRDILPAGVTFAAGSNVVTAILSLITGAGFTRSNIPAKSNTFTKKKAFDAGTPRLDAINDLLMRISYYPLWATRQGIPTSRRVRSLDKEEPVRKISSALGDVVNVVTLDPDSERLCNRVVVIKSAAEEDPIIVVKTNARTDSPVSTVNLGMVLGKTIEASNIDTVAEATDLAMRTLEEGASFLQRISVDTIPDPRFDVRDLVHLVISRADGTLIANGRWWVDQLEVGMTAKAGAQRWRLNRLLPFAPEGS